jgi:hypothetical protein
MRLQTLQSGSGGESIILAETPWHDEASASGGSYRERLKEYLAGYFEAEGKTMHPKTEMLGDSKNPVPDAVRVVDDAGRVIEAYDYRDLMRDTGLTITMPPQADIATE